VSSPRRVLIVVSLILFALAPTAAEAQSTVAVSPFVSYVPSAVKNPLAGMALTFGGTTGLALRGSADLSISNPDKRDSVIGSAGAIGGYRPWAADADAILFLGGLGGGATVFSRSLAPYLFSGIGLTGGDSAGNNVVHNGWSYGAGATIPLGLDADLFAEARWRMSQYVLPTSKGAPDSKSELRFGLSFHVGGGGGGSSEPTREPSRRGRRHRIESDDEGDVTIITPPPQKTTTVNVNLPGSIILSPAQRRRSGRHISVTISRLLPAAESYQGVRYFYGGASPETGFDCSGFTQYVFSRHGVRLPRTSREQAMVGVSVGRDWDALEPGDLVMFADEADAPISHVAIFAGNNRIIHSSASGGGVRYDYLFTTRGAWFRDHMVMARRVTPDASGVMQDLAQGFANVAVTYDPPDRAPRP
jgi:cell wall-associated NlpC family hydrolase